MLSKQQEVSGIRIFGKDGLSQIVKFAEDETERLDSLGVDNKAIEPQKISEEDIKELVKNDFMPIRDMLAEALAKLEVLIITGEKKMVQLETKAASSNVWEQQENLSQLRASQNQKSQEAQLKPGESASNAYFGRG